MIKLITCIVARVTLFSVSVLYVETKRPKVCYKKYLGPDWEPSYEGFSTRVGNHSSWADVLVQMYHQPPSFVSKDSVLKIPFIGKIAEICGSLFLSRGSKDSRKDILKQIDER
jgi:1-acyl-sn-glycerol-3-phosphate acyltransferase